MWVPPVLRAPSIVGFFELATPIGSLVQSCDIFYKKKRNTHLFPSYYHHTTTLISTDDPSVNATYKNKSKQKNNQTTTTTNTTTFDKQNVSFLCAVYLSLNWLSIAISMCLFLYRNVSCAPLYSSHLAYFANFFLSNDIIVVAINSAHHPLCVCVCVRARVYNINLSSSVC